MTSDSEAQRCRMTIADSEAFPVQKWTRYDHSVLHFSMGFEPILNVDLEPGIKFKSMQVHSSFVSSSFVLEKNILI